MLYPPSVETAIVMTCLPDTQRGNDPVTGADAGTVVLLLNVCTAPLPNPNG